MEGHTWIIPSLQMISEKNWPSLCRWDKKSSSFSVVKNDLQEKRSSRTVWTKSAQIQSKNRIATLSVMTSIDFGSLAQHKLATPDLEREI